MRIWLKITRWFDADISSSVSPARSRSALIAMVVPLVIAIPPSFLPTPWREIAIGALAFSWIVGWVFFAVLEYRYMRSTEFLRNTVQSYEVLPHRLKVALGSGESRSYSERKLLAVRNMAIMSLASIAIFLILIIYLPSQVLSTGRSEGFFLGFSIFALIVNCFCLWQFLTSPKQDAVFMKACFKGLSDTPSEVKALKLPDPKDPNFDVPTYRYLARKMGAGRN